MPAYTGCFQPFEKAWEQVLRACSASKVLLNFFQKIAGLRGSEATEIWVPAQTSGAQAPFFGGLLGLSARTASRSERFEANRRRRLLGRDRAKRAAPACCLAGEGVKGNGSLDSSPNFRGASALLRGTSRTCGPKRGIRRDAPSVCLTGEGSVTPPRRPHPGKLGGFLLFLNLKFY